MGQEDDEFESMFGKQVEQERPFSETNDLRSGLGIEVGYGGPLDSPMLRATAFGEAAEVIAQHARKYGAYDHLAVPLLYLHRHCLELILKELIRDADRLIRLWSAPGSHAPPDAVGDEALTKEHALGWLLNKVEERMSWLGLDLDDMGVDHDTREDVWVLHHLDKDGTRLRYAKSQAGEPTSRNEMVVNLPDVHERLVSAASVLGDGVATWLEEHLEYASHPE